MTDVDISFIRGTIQLTPGRQKLASSQILERLNAEERKQIAAIARESIERADDWARLARARRASSPKTFGDLARAEDTAADAVASVIFDLLSGYTRFHAPGTAIGDAARTLLDALFPRGLSAVTQPEFAEELLQLERIVADAKEPELEKTIALVPGLAPLLAELEARAVSYRRALDRKPVSGVRHEDVFAAGRLADRAMLELLAAVFVLHRGDEPATVARRSHLVEPYRLMLENLRERFRRHLPPADVDEAGDVVDAEAEGEASAEPATGAREPVPEKA